MTERRVQIHYHRLPDRIDVFDQRVVAELDACVVTLLEAAPVERVSIISGRRALEPGSPIIWFTYPGRWHDIGRFHLSDGTFTGVYANVLTPVAMEGDRWETTDLCLDVWAGLDGSIELLDEADLADALRADWVTQEVALRARSEAVKLSEAAHRGEWPPREVMEWTLERVRVSLSGQ